VKDPVPSSAPSPPAVDRGAVRQLEEQLGPDSLADLVRTFLARTPDRLAGLRAAVRAGDASTLRDAADSLKGAARSFGAAEVGEIAAQIEHDSAAGSLERADRLVAELAASLDRTHAELDQQLPLRTGADRQSAPASPVRP
jgi:HPt (histidine-containing phosphotransfer) domain-containing protein